LMSLIIIIITEIVMELLIATEDRSFLDVLN